MLHIIFQRFGIPPHEVYNWPAGARRFVYASMQVTFEEEGKQRKQVEASAKKR